MTANTVMAANTECPHKMYMVFDGRYRQDPERSCCLFVPGSTDQGVTQKKAIREAKSFGADCVVVASNWCPAGRVADEGEIVWDSNED